MVAAGLALFGGAGVAAADTTESSASKTAETPSKSSERQSYSDARTERRTARTAERETTESPEAETDDAAQESEDDDTEESVPAKRVRSHTDAPPRRFGVTAREDQDTNEPERTPSQNLLRVLRDIGLWRNTAPEADVVGVPDPTERTATGVITGTDREGDALTYTVVRAPEAGTVDVDSVSGAFTYSPGEIAAQADSFAVGVDDGLAGGVRVIVVSVNLASAPTARKAGVTVGHAGIDIPRGDGSLVAPADWYFPTSDEPPDGIIWLQHGFLLDKAFYPALATTLAEQTNSIVVAPSFTSNFLEPDNYWLNGRPLQRAVADLFTGDRAALNASAAAAGYTGALPQEFVLAGHSAGGGFAATVAGYTKDNGAAEHLAGVVMLDGVALNEALPDALAKLGDIPVYQIAAPSQLWNAFDRGTDQLLAARPDHFDGVVLVGGSHADAMLGVNPLFDIAVQLVTQLSPPGHTHAVGTVAAGWINDFYTGERLGVYGTPGQELLVNHVPVSVLGAPVERNQFELLVKAVTNLAMRLLFDRGGEEPAGVRVSHSDLELAEGVTVNADWYFPEGQPTGVIYLQHGFFRSSGNVSALAITLARQTDSIVVAPSLSSNFVGNDPYWINGEATQQAVAALFADRAALNASAAAAGYTAELPGAYVLAGHSAGGNLATAAGGLLGEDPDLKGIVLFDAVDRDGDMAEGLRGLDGVPVYQIAAEPCLCNDYGSGTTVLETQRPGEFVGVRLVGGTHVDAEGVSADLLSSLLCGFSPPGNASAVQTIAAGWITDMFAGTDDGMYPAAGESVALGRATAVGLGGGRSQRPGVDAQFLQPGPVTLDAA
jgi:hypothetical protein